MTETGQPVVIVGCGGRTPLGGTLAASAAAVRAGMSAVRLHPFFIDWSGEPVSAAWDPSLPAGLSIIGRLEQLLTSAIVEAIAPLAARRTGAISLPLVLGLPEPRPGLPQEFTRELTLRLQADPVGSVRLAWVKTVAEGHAAGLMAVEHAWQRLRSGQEEFALAAGVDSYLTGESLDWLDANGQLMSAENRSGFLPGEGAGCCLLATASAAGRHGLAPLGRVVNAAMAREANRIKTETICIGEGLTKAIRDATGGLRLPEERIDFTFCDLNGERYRNEEYTFTVVRVQKAFREPNLNATPADSWGDLGAAFGPLGVGLATTASQRGYANGPRALVWASSENGQRAALVLQMEPTAHKG